jgi:hypothetical protein
MIKPDNEDIGVRRIRNLIDSGAEIAGGAVGGALSFLAGDPIGATMSGAGGAVVTSVLRYIGNEVSERHLGPREKIRIGGVLAIAASEINRRIQRGEKIRDDDFFEEEQKGRTDAAEVLESVLLKSQREPEEKKLPYMGYMLANIVFDREIKAEMAHQITKVAEQLTYRQLCVLKLAVVKDSFDLKNGDYRGQGSFSKELYQILYECLYLSQMGLINFGGEVVFGPTDIAPSNMTVQGLGVDLYDLMQLQLIPNPDIVPVAAVLK